MPVVLDVGGVCRHRRLYVVFLHAVLNDATHMPVGAQKNDCALAGLRVRSHRAESAQSQARECAVAGPRVRGRESTICFAPHSTQMPGVPAFVNLRRENADV